MLENNLPTVSKETQSLRQLFNGSFYQNVPVDEGTYSIIYGFFLDRTMLPEAADTLTHTVLTIGFNNKINPLDVLNEFDKAATDSDFKKILVALVNTGRVETSKVGYNRGSVTNKWAQRAIIA